MECEIDDDPCNGPLEPNTLYLIPYQLLSGEVVADYDFEVLIKTGQHFCLAFSLLKDDQISGSKSRGDINREMHRPKKKEKNNTQIYRL